MNAEALDCLIVGAGAAGLAAATVLMDAVRTFLVVGGRLRIGGRAHSLPLFDGTPLEQDASRLHGDVGLRDPNRGRDVQVEPAQARKAVRQRRGNAVVAALRRRGLAEGRRAALKALHLLWPLQPGDPDSRIDWSYSTSLT